MAPKTWLVTGSSPNSIGEHIVLSALARGERVIATARSTEKLANLEKAGAKILQLDVTADQAVLDQKIQEALKLAGGEIDVLVNNAGNANMNIMEEITTESILATFEPNTFGPMRLTRALLPHLRSRRTGTLVFISSVSGFVSYGGSGIYGASKHALNGFVDSLHQETHSLGIKSIVIEPGFVRTNLIANANLITTKIPDYQPLVDALVPMIGGLDGNQPGDPHKCAEIVVDVVKGEGVAVGKVLEPWGPEFPLRLALGEDGYQGLRTKVDGFEKVLQSWGDVMKSTGFDK